MTEAEAVTGEIVADAPQEEIAVPVSGEIIALNSPNLVLAEAAAYMGELKRELMRVEDIVTAELARRMDKANERTVKEKGFQLTVTAPERDWDLPQLRKVLDEFVEKDRITRDAADRVVVTETPAPVTKLVKKELNKLLNGELPEVAKKQLRRCSSPTKRVRKAKVTKTAEVAS